MDAVSWGMICDVKPRRNDKYIASEPATGSRSIGAADKLRTGPESCNLKRTMSEVTTQAEDDEEMRERRKRCGARYMKDMELKVDESFGSVVKDFRRMKEEWELILNCGSVASSAIRDFDGDRFAKTRGRARALPTSP